MSKKRLPMLIVLLVLAVLASMVAPSTEAEDPPTPTATPDPAVTATNSPETPNPTITAENTGVPTQQPNETTTPSPTPTTGSASTTTPVAPTVPPNTVTIPTTTPTAEPGSDRDHDGDVDVVDIMRVVKDWRRPVQPPTVQGDVRLTCSGYAHLCLIVVNTQFDMSSEFRFDDAQVTLDESSDVFETAVVKNYRFGVQPQTASLRFDLISSIPNGYHAAQCELSCVTGEESCTSQFIFVQGQIPAQLQELVEQSQARRAAQP